MPLNRKLTSILKPKNMQVTGYTDFFRKSFNLL